MECDCSQCEEEGARQGRKQGVSEASLVERPETTMFSSGPFKSPRNQKRFHSRYNFGYGILLYMPQTACFCPLTALFGGFEGVFSLISDKSAILCPGKTEAADFVSFKGLIVHRLDIEKV